MVECEKSVFAADPVELESEFEYLSRKYGWIKFTKSKDSLMSQSYGITLANPGLSRIPSHAVGLVQSGIHGRLMREKVARKNFRRKRSGAWKPTRDKMALDGCISTLFILCGGLASISIVIFGAECWKRIVYVTCKWNLKIQKY